MNQCDGPSRKVPSTLRALIHEYRECSFREGSLYIQEYCGLLLIKVYLRLSLDGYSVGR